MRLLETRQRECLPGAGHRHVVEPARRVLILALSDAIPATVEYGDMVELQPLGSVPAQQQQPVLTPAYLPAPLRQPLDDMIDRHVSAARLQPVLLDRLPQEVVPGIVRPRFDPVLQGGPVNDAGLSCARPLDEGPGLAQAPEIGDFLVAPLATE